jgi:uncharacterized protein YprB with RNaseH-like and TPR domain
MSKPKVLIFDIETAPVLGHVWSLWRQNVGLNQIKEDWYMLSWAAKWYGEDEVMYMDCRNTPHDDKEILVGLHELLDEADWCITHNGDKFDIPKVRARMLLSGLPPFSPMNSIDTCRQAKRVFGLTSNKLEYLSDKLCPEQKKSKHEKFSGFDLWAECLKGNPEAWDEMETYNRQDVVALEGVYNKMLPWMSQHPNFGLFKEEGSEKCCPKCGGKVHRRGYRHTQVGIYQRYQCQSCHGWSSARLMDKTDRSHVLKVLP